MTVAEIDQALADLKHEDDGVRNDALFALASLDPASVTVEVLKAILAAHGDEDDDNCLQAETTLEELYPGIPLAIKLEAFLWALEHDDVEVRECAILALPGFEVGTLTPEILSALVGRLEDQDEHEQLRGEAARSLASCEAPAATPRVFAAIIDALKRGSASLRIEAANALGELHGLASTRDVTAALIVSLTDDDAHVREASASALGMISAPANLDEVAAALITAARDPEQNVRLSASESLLFILQNGELQDHRSRVLVAVKADANAREGLIEYLLEPGASDKDPEEDAQLVADLRA